MRNLRPPELHTFKSGYIGNPPELKTYIEALMPTDVPDQPRQGQDFFNVMPNSFPDPVLEITSRRIHPMDVEPLFPAGLNPKSYCENYD